MKVVDRAVALLAVTLLVAVIGARPAAAQAPSFEVERVAAEQLLDAKATDESAVRRIDAYIERARIEYGPRGEPYAKLLLRYVGYVITRSPSGGNTAKIGDLERAAKPAAEALIILRRLAPGSLDLLQALYFDGMIKLTNGRTDKALQTLSEATALDRKLRGGDEADVAQTLEGMADLLEALQLYSAAETLLLEAVEIRTRLHGPDSRPLIPVLIKLRAVRRQLGNAGPTTQRLRQLAETAIAAGDAEDAELVLLASIVQDELSEKFVQSDETGARRLLATLDQLAAKLASPELRAAAEIQAWQHRGLLAISLGHDDEASAHFTSAIERGRKAVAATSPGKSRESFLDSLVTSLNMFGEMEVATGRWGPAKRALEEALELIGDPARAPTGILARLAEISRQLGDPAEADRWTARALAARKLANSEILVHFVTSRDVAQQTGADLASRFGTTQADHLTFGKAIVIAPKALRERSDHSRTMVEAGPLSIPRSTNAGSLTIQSVELQSQGGVLADAFVRNWQRVGQSIDVYSGPTVADAARTRSALVFIHGYNVTFDDGVRSAAQLAHDLNFEAPTFLFSWPSHGAVFRYFSDQGNAAQSCPMLADFLASLAQPEGPDKVHIIAHSMGNQVLVCALQRLVARRDIGAIAPRIGEIVFASPDVDISDFRAAIAKITAAGIKGLTLYASAHDKALLARQIIGWGNTRAGLVSNGAPVTAAGLDSIDLSNAGSALFNLNHGVFAVNPVVIEDIRRLLRTSQHPPAGRIPQLTRVAEGSGVFWRYQGATPSETGSSADAPRRDGTRSR